MANFKNVPAITQKYHIEVPLHEYYSGACVYKVSFGEKYFIGKGKALLQSVQTMAIIIERGLRLRNHQDIDMHYHVVSHIIRNSVQRGYTEVLGGEGLSEFDLLKLEQETLNNAINDPNCLNNSFDAYVPQWMNEIEVQKFLQWKGITRDELLQRSRERKKDDIFDIIYFNPLDKNKRGVYKLYFGDEYYYVGRAKVLYNRTLNHKREIKKRVSGFTKMNENDFYTKIIKCIADNSLKIATCCLIKECNTIDELVSEEQKILDKSKDDKYCLNIGFIAKRSSREIDETLEESLKRTPLVIFKNGNKHFIKRTVAKK